MGEKAADEGAAPKEEMAVFDYRMRDLGVDLSVSAQEFMDAEKKEGSDFYIDSLVAGLSGIQKNRDRDLDLLVEEKVLSRLKVTHESAYKKAYELGYSDGFEKAFEDQKANIDDRLAKWDLLLSSMNSCKVDLFNQSERIILKLLFSMAEKLVGREIKVDPSVIASVVRTALSDIQDDDNMILKLSPDDSAFIKTYQDKNKKEMLDLENVKIEVSEEIDSGGCVLETNYGIVDAQLPTRLERLWKSLEEKYPSLQGHNISLVETEKNVAPPDAEDEIKSEEEESGGTKKGDQE